MLLDLALNSSDVVKICLIGLFLLTVAAILYLLVLREKAKLTPAQPVVQTPVDVAGLDTGDSAPSTSVSTSTGGFKFRKIAPHLLAIGFIVLFVLLQFVLKHVPALDATPAAALPLPSNGVLPDVDGAAQDTKQALGGYVQFGTLISKIIVLVIFYAIGSFLPWVFQQLTHPGPTKWKKEHYTADFDALEPIQKFEVDAKLGLNASIRWAAVVVGACLIQ